MTLRNNSTSLVAAVAGATVLLVAFAASADRRGNTAPREVTLTGKVVDLHEFMTDKYCSNDKVKCARTCIQEGVPPALETPEGLFVLGQGIHGPRKTLTRLAFLDVEVTGMMYERNGLRYIDISEIVEVKVEAEEEPADQPEREAESAEEGAAAAVSGACCFSGGECEDLNAQECAESEGDWHPRTTCEQFECDPDRP